MRDRSAERGQSEPKEHAQDFKRTSAGKLLGGRGLLARRHRRFGCLRCYAERKLDGGLSGRQISSADILPHHFRFLVFGNMAMIHEGIA
jgi:hypothetical protein